MIQNKRVLIADDERIVRESLSDWLTDRGYQVVTAENGEQTLKTLKAKNNFGVVVLDVRMPSLALPLGLAANRGVPNTSRKRA